MSGWRRARTAGGREPARVLAESVRRLVCAVGVARAAAACGVSERTVLRWGRGDAQMTLGDLERLLAACGRPDGDGWGGLEDVAHAIAWAAGDPDAAHTGRRSEAARAGRAAQVGQRRKRRAA